MSRFSTFGNELHSGQRSIPIVPRRKWWYLGSALILVILAAITGVRGVNWGIEFTGGSEFQISHVKNPDQALARDVVREHVPSNEPRISQVGGNILRVQTEELSTDATKALSADLAKAYNVPVEDVSSSFVGPNWGGDVTAKAIQGIVIFMLLVTIVMALYFRNFKSSVAAMAALTHDLLFTIVAYGAIGFEVTPATVIGFLTVLGYSLYDTVVVFDKVRENTEGFLERTDASFATLVNRATNQTLVRSINTSVVALLPVGSILIIGAFILGAGTLKDISLALFVGIIAGTYSSIFLAPSFLVDLRKGEKSIKDHTLRVERTHEKDVVTA